MTSRIRVSDTDVDAELPAKRHEELGPFLRSLNSAVFPFRSPVERGFSGPFEPSMSWNSSARSRTSSAAVKSSTVKRKNELATASLDLDVLLLPNPPAYLRLQQRLRSAVRLIFFGFAVFSAGLGNVVSFGSLIFVVDVAGTVHVYFPTE